MENTNLCGNLSIRAKQNTTLLWYSNVCCEKQRALECTFYSDSKGSGFLWDAPSYLEAWKLLLILLYTQENIQHWCWLRTPKWRCDVGNAWLAFLLGLASGGMLFLKQLECHYFEIITLGNWLWEIQLTSKPLTPKAHKHEYYWSKSFRIKHVRKEGCTAQMNNMPIKKQKNRLKISP